MILERKLSSANRAALAARGWQLRSLFQPLWLFRPGPRKLARCALPDDPWLAWVEREGENPLLRDFIAQGQGDTPDEAVERAIASRSNFRDSMFLLEHEIARLIEACRGAS